MNSNIQYKKQEIRAQFNSDTITVYQAYNSKIAQAAVENQTFTSPAFKIERMTWIKPSFLWMMYRSGWGKKENQECILAIKIKRSGFEWALKHACLSHFVQSVHTNSTSWKKALNNAPVRIQWDPEKDLFLNALPYRSIQIGLHKEAVKHYVTNWIVSIEDITKTCREIHSHICNKQPDKALNLLPKESTYPLPEHLKSTIMHS